MLCGTAVAYLWNLTASGMANSFYAAAVEAGTKSWKAFFFGSLDSSNFITVDKPPASLWIMELSGRLFGFNSASMLIPQVLEGVATVALVYAVVRRWFGHRYGMVAGLVMATMPVAALMFRFNNPDALLVLLLTAAGYGVTRAIERGSTRWLVLAGTAVGFAFLAKMGQALLVVPALGAAYLLAAPGRLARRAWQLAAALGAMVVAAGWWVLSVMLWPVSDRPMIDGSPTNSIWNLIVGYNGLGRIFGSGPGGGGGGGGGFSGATGLFRLFNDLMGGQASWLLPTALVALVGGLALTARRPRLDRTRAALVLWGGWLVVTGLVFSFGRGVIHTYYTVALAPAIAVLVAIGVAMLVEQWKQRWAPWVAVGTLALTSWWAWELLDRSPSWEPWLRPTVVAAAVLASTAIALTRLGTKEKIRRSATTVAVATAAFVGLAGSTAYSLETIGTAHSGSVPSAGPSLTSSLSGGGPGGGGGGPGGMANQGAMPTDAGFSGASPSGSTTQRQFGPARPSTRGFGDARAALGSQRSSSGAVSSSSRTASGQTPTGSRSGQTPSGSRSGDAPMGSSSGEVVPRTSTAVGTAGGGGVGGGGGHVSNALVAALRHDAAKYRWVAAVDGSQSAASLELATGGEPVMAIGGFNGQGGNLTLAQFERYVKAGEIHYYFVSGSGGAVGPGGGTSSTAISSWVESHFKSETIGGTAVYDLTRAKS